MWSIFKGAGVFPSSFEDRRTGKVAANPEHLTFENALAGANQLRASTERVRNIEMPGKPAFPKGRPSCFVILLKDDDPERRAKPHDAFQPVGPQALLQSPEYRDG